MNVNPSISALAATWIYSEFDQHFFPEQVRPMRMRLHGATSAAAMRMCAAAHGILHLST